MDRDVALQLLTSLDTVNTAVQTLVTNTTPDASPASLSMSWLGSSAEHEEEPETMEEQETPEEPETIPEDDNK